MHSPLGLCSFPDFPDPKLAGSFHEDQAPTVDLPLAVVFALTKNLLHLLYHGLDYIFVT
jgi:hypothetical protein